MKQGIETADHLIPEHESGVPNTPLGHNEWVVSSVGFVLMRKNFNQSIFLHIFFNLYQHKVPNFDAIGTIGEESSTMIAYRVR